MLKISEKNWLKIFEPGLIRKMHIFSKPAKDKFYIL